MTEDSLVITYETLYEILRAEKNKEELCELDENFYVNVLNYLKEKTQILQEASSKSDIFSMDEKDNTQVQLQNIRKIIKEIYERREKKIIGMALNKSRTNSDIIDTSNLLTPEKKFFATLCDLFDNFRIGILARILKLQDPNLSIECSMDTSELNSSEKQKNEETEEESKENVQEKTKTEPITIPKPTQIPEQEKNIPESQKPEIASQTTKKIKITKATEQFIGKELEMYGPYKEEEVTEVPLEIAEILIGKGSAVEVE
ncbi:hypothetical protein GF358_03920 [Candidatus Woesearchaeota archaeon]|nr:hypothetical protein [Candidatus Woesearchaeota archaeon]